MTAAEKTAVEIERALSPYASAERQSVMSAGYAPTALRGMGVPVPKIRDVVRQCARELAEQPPRFVISVALALTKRRTTEGRHVGWELVARRRDAMALLTPRLVEALGRGNDNWASVDGFATYLAGVAWREGTVRDADVLRWSRSPDRWWRRTALVSTVALNVAARGGSGDPVRTLRISSRFVNERDPMLTKALSWALRSLVATHPKDVAKFMKQHKARLAPLVVREVTTKLKTGLKSPRPRG